LLVKEWVVAARISCRRAGENHSGSAVHGDIDIIPAGISARWESHDRADIVLLIGLPAPMLNTAAEEYGFDSKRVEIRNRFQVRDPQLQTIGWTMKSEVELGSPSGRLFMDGLALSAMARLTNAHSSVATRDERRGELAGRTLKIILEYIEEHLSEDLSLALLAKVAGLSQSHFRALFRASVGTPVHQYVIQRRVERAKSLLMNDGLSVADIALASGFAHQSHLARHLQRESGLSPTKMKYILLGSPHLKIGNSNR
jgi:AraC family transcriptional regulator